MEHKPVSPALRRLRKENYKRDHPKTLPSGERKGKQPPNSGSVQEGTLSSVEDHENRCLRSAAELDACVPGWHGGLYPLATVLNLLTFRSNLREKGFHKLAMIKLPVLWKRQFEIRSVIPVLGRLRK